MRPSTFGEILRFLKSDGGWASTRGTGHDFFEKALPDGTVLSTHVSHALDKSPGRGRFGQILKYQLKVSEAEFWAVISEDRPARRPQPEAPPQPRPLTLQIILQLRKELGLTETDMVGMTFDDGLRLLTEHRSKPRTE